MEERIPAGKVQCWWFTCLLRVISVGNKSSVKENRLPSGLKLSALLSYTAGCRSKRPSQRAPGEAEQHFG